MPPITLENLNELKRAQLWFTEILKGEKNVSAGIAAIRTLLLVLKFHRAETMQELDAKINATIKVMTAVDAPLTAIISGCELFKRFITLAQLDHKVFSDCKNVMLNRGEIFLKKISEARGKIAKLASLYILNGYKIMVHSKSRVVLEALKMAVSCDKIFQVYITRCSIDESGEEMLKDLEAVGISCTLILDSAVAHVMERVDIILVGAEGVVESGGIINKIGSFTMAICARELNKPFYVLTESFKFTRFYPLNQGDIPKEYKYTASILNKGKLAMDREHPLVDYTPPSYITLLFTDLGILTPAAVSDELIKLYL